MSAVAMLLVAGLLTAAGGRLAATLAPQGDRSERLALAFVAGLVAAYPIWLVVDAAGIGWWVLTLLASAGIVALLGHGLHRAIGTDVRSDSNGAGRRLALGWGDALAAVSCSTVAVLAAKLWIVNPDFVYHWGIKGHRFYHLRGIDLAFLADPKNWPVHPDYPNLIPSLFAHTALIQGEFDESAMMLWSAVFLALLAVLARAALVRAGIDRWWTQGSVAAVALAGGIFSVGFLAAGGADLPVALAPILAWPALTRRETSAADDLRVGLAAALAAAAKIEGVPMAGLLVIIYLCARDDRGLRFLRLGSLARTVLPPAAVALPWLVTGLGAGLFVSHAGALDWARWPFIQEGLLHVAGQERLRGLPWLLLLLPVLGSSGEPAASHWCSPGSWASTSTSTSATRCPPRIARPSSPRRTSADSRST